MDPTRYNTWKKHLVVLDDKQCQTIFHRLDKRCKTNRVIHQDVQRTHLTNEKNELELLLHLYEHTHQADGYVQGMNYLMAMIIHVFPSRWERWWAFTRIMVFVRPMIPEFHPKWASWFHKYWLVKYKIILKSINRQLYDILEPSLQDIARLMTFRWFFIWFTQTFDKQDLFIIWDALITTPHHRRIALMCAIAAAITSQAQTFIMQHTHTERTYQIINIKAKQPKQILQHIQGYY